MAPTKLDVPLLAQEQSMCCWHTSANMIWAYWQQKTGRQGPMNTVTPIYASNSTISPHEFIVLAEKVGLLSLPTKNTHTIADIEGYLKTHGPIWCAGYWYGLGHVIVLSGINGGTVYINDPDGGKRKTGTLAWFNSKLANALPGCLMYKDPDRY